MSETTNPIREAAIEYSKLGLNVIPLIPGQKNPSLPEWKKYQNEKFTDLEAFRPDGNIGVICGGISRNLFVLDFETKESFEAFFPDRVERDKILSETWVVKSGGERGGLHVYLFNDKPVKSLAVHDVGTVELDVQGEGRLIVMPPSRTKNEYRFLNKPAEPKTAKKNFELFILERLAELGINKKKKIRDIALGVTKGNRHSDALRMALYYTKIMNLEPDSALAALKHWATLCNPPYDDAEDLERALQWALNADAPKGKSDKNVEPVTEENPGVWNDSAKFEQIITAEGYRFATIQDGKIAIVEQIGNYVPCRRLFWLTPPGVPEKGTKEEVWKEIMEYLYVHIDFDDPKHYAVVASFILATWSLDRWNSVPYLELEGKPSTGKTRVLECVQMLGYRGIMSPSFTQATTFRIMDAYQPILLFDEAAKFFRGDGELMDIVKAGQRRHQYVYRMEKDPETGKMSLRGFDPFGFKCFATTKKLDDQLESRCIQMTMSRAVRYLPPFVDEEWARDIRSKLLYLKFQEKITNTDDIDYPELINGRISELFAPLTNVAPVDRYNLLINVALKIQNIRTADDQDTLAADIIAVVADLMRNGKLVNNRTFIAKDIVAGIFERRGIDPEKNRKETDFINVKTVGHDLAPLGFEHKGRLDNKSAWNVIPYPFVRQLMRYFPNDPLIDTLVKNGKNGRMEESGLDAFHSSISSIPTEGILDGLTDDEVKEAATIKRRSKKDIIASHKRPKLMTPGAFVRRWNRLIAAVEGYDALLLTKHVFGYEGRILDPISMRILQPTGAQAEDDTEIYIDNIARYAFVVWRRLPEPEQKEERLIRLIRVMTDVTVIHEATHAFGFSEKQARRAQWFGTDVVSLL